jgi:hypothetical protein
MLHHTVFHCYSWCGVVGQLVLQVLSPLPQFVNPGNTAWASGGGSPLFFVMRCNPQHYYLLHEIGHRFGMPHATTYKLANQTASPEVRLAAGDSVRQEDAIAVNAQGLCCGTRP